VQLSGTMQAASSPYPHPPYYQGLYHIQPLGLFVLNTNQPDADFPQHPTTMTSSASTSPSYHHNKLLKYV